MRTVKVKSGLRGWEGKLHEVYKSFEEFVDYCTIYRIHERLGFKTPEKAWKTNPTIQGSVSPNDLRIAPPKKVKTKI